METNRYYDSLPMDNGQCSKSRYYSTTKFILTSDDQEEQMKRGNQYRNTARKDGEDMQWHDQQFTRKVCLQKKIDEYISSFNLHGLTRVLTASRVESLFWLMIIFSGSVLAFVIVYGLVEKYFKFDIYTEIRIKETDENLFPTVTFCEQQMLMKKYFTHCGIPVFTDEIPKGVDTSRVCPEDYNNIRSSNRGIESINERFWSNGYFNITSCRTWDGQACMGTKFFKRMEHFEDECIQFNYKGTLSDLYTHVNIEFKYINPNEKKHVENEYALIAIAHDNRIHELDLSKRVKIQLDKHNEIKIAKTEIKRLPAPYPSKCSNSKTYDIFPGIYSRHSCILSHKFIEDYKKCGDTLDYVRKYIPEDMKKKYKKSKSIGETINCLKSFREAKTKLKDICAFPCNELEFTAVRTFKSRKLTMRNTSRHKYTVSFQYQQVDTYSIMEEKPLYKWDQLACEIGGFLGLVIGASILSVVEILVSVVLVIVKKCL